MNRPVAARRQAALCFGLLAGGLATGPAAAQQDAPAVRPRSAAAQAVTSTAGDAAARPRSGTLRARSFALDEGWRFALVNDRDATDPTGAFDRAYEPEFDDSAWRTLSIPHDWSIELTPRADGGTSAGTGYLPGGLAWYRNRFVLPADLGDARVSVEFDGIYMDARVYVNGREVGGHAYGYTGFALDITDTVHFDGRENVIAVKVQNRLPSSRWYSGSGIYRHARIVVTHPVHVRRWGTFVTTPNLEADLADGHATLEVRTAVSNETAEEALATVVSTVRDASGRDVASAAGRMQLAPVSSGTDVASVGLDAPKLWSPTEPNLYSLLTDVYVDGRRVDSYETRFGVRYVEIDPERGLAINGEHMKIQGVNLHHDLGALGSAVNRDALLRQLTIMKSMGVNAIRTAHNPPAPELVEICESLGILMMVEAFDMWNRPKSRFDYGRFFEDQATADVTEMVLAARNSPAVLMWSIGNEIRDPTVDAAQRLVGAVKAADPTRPVVWGSDGYRALPEAGSTLDRIVELLDGLGVNYNTAKSVDALHARYPDKFLFESESSSSTSTRGVYDQPGQLNTGENYTPGKRGASSYDNNMAPWTMPGEYGLKKDRDRRFFTGEFLWSGFDYLGEPTPYFNVFPVKSSFFGAVDTAGFPKDLYWLFRSQWTDEPMVHLVPMNWTDHARDELVEVWAYANVEAVELFLNGRSLGVRRFDRKTTLDGREYLETSEPSGDDKTFASGSYTSPNGGTGKLHLAWKVPFEPGVLRAVAYRGGTRVASDEVRTAGRPHALRLAAEETVIDADADALAFVTVEVVDADGVVVPQASNAVRIDVRGGRVAGLDSGRPESAERYRGPSRRAFNGKLLAIVASDGAAGAMTVRATADGLLPAVVTIHEVAASRSSLPAAVDTLAAADTPAGVAPVYLRAPLGVAPELPERVVVSYIDGRSERLPVSWDRSAAATASRIRGRIDAVDAPAADAPAVAIISRYSLAAVDEWRTSVPLGTAPMLPGFVRVRYSDGVSAYPAVRWEAVPRRLREATGVYTLTGHIDALDLTASATVTVGDRFAPSGIVAGAGSARRVEADASYSGRADTIPSNMIDGERETAWSNYYRKAATPLLPAVSSARASDWVSLAWETPQAVDSVAVYFVESDTHAFPSRLSISAWNGSAFVPATDVEIDSGDGADAPTRIRFDPVSTTAIRLDMASGSPGEGDGFLAIAELEIYGDPRDERPPG